MRLTPDQTQAIRQRIHSHMGEHARIWLFGSRVDDSHRGADVDLYVEPATAPNLTAPLRCRREWADAFGLSVGFIVPQPGRDLPSYRIAERRLGAAVTGRRNLSHIKLHHLSRIREYLCAG